MAFMTGMTSEIRFLSYDIETPDTVHKVRRREEVVVDWRYIVRMEEMKNDYPVLVRKPNDHSEDIAYELH